MEDVRAELLRLRARQDEIATEIATLRLDLADVRAETRQLMIQNAKYIPIIEALDDLSIAERATVAATAKEASKIATRTVAAVSIVGVVANVLVSVLHVWLP